MAGTRQMSETERGRVRDLLSRTRLRLEALASGDPGLLWAARRYVYISLQNDERGKPAKRKRLKHKKWLAQHGLCAMCGNLVEERGSELDRINPMAGYTEESTRLLCHECHRKDQEKKGFA